MDPILVLFSLIVVVFFLKKCSYDYSILFCTKNERSSGEDDYSIFFSMIKIRGCIFLKVTLFPIHVRSHFIHHGTRKIIRYRGKSGLVNKCK